MQKVKVITAQEVISVRHPVLRTNKPMESAIFVGDDAETTIHLGCFIHEKLVGVTTVMAQPNQELEGNQWQLRGMAVLPEVQGQGMGSVLVSYAEKLALEKGIDVIWMNAREIARPFYEKLGFAVFGKPFQIPEIGLHYAMFKHLK